MTFHGLAEYLFIAHKLSKISERHENIRYSKKKKKSCVLFVAGLSCFWILKIEVCLVDYSRD